MRDPRRVNVMLTRAMANESDSLPVVIDESERPRKGERLVGRLALVLQWFLGGFIPDSGGNP